MSKNEENCKEKESEKAAPEVEEKISKTQHSITVNGKKLDYTVTAGTIILKEEARLGRPQFTIPREKQAAFSNTA